MSAIGWGEIATILTTLPDTDKWASRRSGKGDEAQAALLQAEGAAENHGQLVGREHMAVLRELGVDALGPDLLPGDVELGIERREMEQMFDDADDGVGRLRSDELQIRWVADEACFYEI